MKIDKQKIHVDRPKLLKDVIRKNYKNWGEEIRKKVRKIQAEIFKIENILSFDQVYFWYFKIVNSTFIEKKINKITTSVDEWLEKKGQW